MRTLVEPSARGARCSLGSIQPDAAISYPVSTAKGLGVDLVLSSSGASLHGSLVAATSTLPRMGHAPDTRSGAGCNRLSPAALTMAVSHLLSCKHKIYTQWNYTFATCRRPIPTCHHGGVDAGVTEATWFEVQSKLSRSESPGRAGAPGRLSAITTRASSRLPASRLWNLVPGNRCPSGCPSSRHSRRCQKGSWTRARCPVRRLRRG